MYLHFLFFLRFGGKGRGRFNICAPHSLTKTRFVLSLAFSKLTRCSPEEAVRAIHRPGLGLRSEFSPSLPKSSWQNFDPISFLLHSFCFAFLYLQISRGFWLFFCFLVQLNILFSSSEGDFFCHICGRSFPSPSPSYLL